ncbi:ATP-grasp domain-containing protein [Paraburkholderia sp. 1N]|uniref:ATP-grasp domain-containing protein n=1 Tax=Paraburkholderia solitsugae TaxID=2675748 RepID=A0ABX2BHH8_9BURK|nr:ATP-grasp domain-containing protein [Paraburkholderia solitsugae]NPT40412.1 ATP-grasp domain-containing protein [Paraburkholderia solitsugae]
MNQPTLVVAGLSARMLAESARRAGWRVIALDLFGDVDTRAAVDEWHQIGDPATLQLDPARTYAALERAASLPGVMGWVAGSGFESCPQLLQARFPALPLLGNPSQAYEAVRTPARFFGLLAAQGIPFPETLARRPPETTGWLRKDARGTGGWHIRRAGFRGDVVHEAHPDVYFQRTCAGRSMSAMFIANGSSATVLGFNEQIIVPQHRHPFTWRGAIGPVQMPADLAAQVHHAVQTIVASTRLVGLNSLDFLLDGERFFVLEVNPRPSATMALYDGHLPLSPLALHVRACKGEALDPPQHTPHTPHAVPTPHTSPAPLIRGEQIVFARTGHTVSAAFVARAQQRGWCHDIPAPGSTIAAGTPLCSVSVTCAPGTSTDAVRAELAARASTIESMMKVSHDDPITVR